jgi:hypothetical protein
MSIFPSIKAVKYIINAFGDHCRQEGHVPIVVNIDGFRNNSLLTKIREIPGNEYTMIMGSIRDGELMRLPHWDVELRAMNDGSPIKVTGNPEKVAELMAILFKP